MYASYHQDNSLISTPTQVMRKSDSPIARELTFGAAGLSAAALALWELGKQAADRVLRHISIFYFSFRCRSPKPKGCSKRRRHDK